MHKKQISNYLVYLSLHSSFFKKVSLVSNGLQLFFFMIILF